MTVLQTSASATLRSLRNVEFVAGRDLSFIYNVELLASDVAAGVTLTQAIIRVMDTFGGTTYLRKSVSTVLSSAGQVSDNGATDGVGKLSISLGAIDTLFLPAPSVFEVIVIDSLNRETQLDAGALVKVSGSGVAEAPIYTATVVLSGGAVTTAAVATNDPAVLMALNFDAAGPAKFATGALYLMDNGNGAYQTVNADGASPTGFSTPLIDDYLHPGAGNHFRPTSGYANGSPCLASGELCGEGVEVPASTGLGQGTADPNAETAVPGNASLKDYLPPSQHGVTYFAISKLEDGARMYTIGEDGSGDNYLDGDLTTFPGNAQAYLFDASSGSGFTQASTYCLNAVTALRWLNPNGITVGGTTGPVNIGIKRVGRDFINEDTNPVDPTASRRIRLMHKGSNYRTPSSRQGMRVFGVIKGHPSPAQWKILNDWAKARYPALWTDTRNLDIVVSDSFYSPLLMQNIIGSRDGATQIPNCTGMNFSQSGRSPTNYLYPKTRNWLVGAMDFSDRPNGGVIFDGNESLNEGTTIAVAQMNYKWLDRIKALNPTKIVCTSALSMDVQTDAAETAFNTDMEAHMVQDGHAVVLGDLWRTSPMTPQHFNGGNKLGPYWLTTGEDISQHPSDRCHQYLEPQHRARVIYALGLEDLTRTVKLVPNAELFTLTAGAPTATLTPTAKNRVGTNLGGKTYTFLSGNNAVATVSAAGLITRIGVGETWVKATSNDGVPCFVRVVCT